MTRSGVAFTPKATRDFESLVRSKALEVFDIPMDGPVFVSIQATFEIPKSWPKKRQAAEFGRPHIQRPDLDNCMKAILDGLNRVAFADDSQVAEMHLSKRWGHVAQTVVVVREVDRHDGDWGLETSEPGGACHTIPALDMPS